MALGLEHGGTALALLYGTCSVTCRISCPTSGSTVHARHSYCAPAFLLLCVVQVEERDALVQLVNAQAQEIDRLKGQLGALRRKDTSMYA